MCIIFWENCHCDVYVYVVSFLPKKKLKYILKKKIVIPVSSYQPSELTASALYSSPFASIKNRQKNAEKGRNLYVL